MSLHFNATTSIPTPALVGDEDPLLCIQWTIGSRSSAAAIDMRDAVIAKAEALLDASGLLIHWEGASIDETTIQTTFVVADFATARDVVWSSLSEAETRNECRVFQIDA